MLNYRKIETADDKRIAGIIRANLEKLHLNIPGTAYSVAEGGFAQFTLLRDFRQRYFSRVYQGHKIYAAVFSGLSKWALFAG